MLDLNPEFCQALDHLENSPCHLFLTGKAGTGKSTLLTLFRDQGKRPAVILAPTGVAAVNVSGETIHAFFGFKPNVTLAEARKAASSHKKKELFCQLDTIIIDEASMVRADLLDCVDQFLQVVRRERRPFGGTRMVFIGDLYQLPPVVSSREREAFSHIYPSPYFFDARVIQEMLAADLSSLAFIELQKIYRQTDTDFIEFLGRIRTRSVTEADIAALDSRLVDTIDHDPQTVVLTGRKDQAELLNREHLAELPGRRVTYLASSTGDYTAGHMPTNEELQLKVGARVMFVSNESAGRWVNGTLGTVEKCAPDEVTVRLDTGGSVKVGCYTWELSHTVFDRAHNRLEREVTGSFTQMPLILARAITIHKSQGKTFDRVVIDLDRGAFAHGQVYVALSRCRTFAGISLRSPIKKSHVLMDYRVSRFLTNFAYSRADLEQLPDERLGLLHQAMKERRTVTITYLKAKNELSERPIIPRRIEKQEYNGHEFTALVAYCHLREEERTFNLERILKVESVG